MSILKRGDTVALVACSDLLKENQQDVINRVIENLNKLSLKVKISDYIYEVEEMDIVQIAKKKAEALMDFYKDDEVKAIFDVSGGNLANTILDYLDYETIKIKNKAFFGYSDVSVVLNALYSKSSSKNYLYQIRNIASEYESIQRKELENLLFKDDNKLLKFNYKWIQGSNLEGIVLGGNIRCLLKLSGTEFMPDFQDKVIFLESLSGGVNMMSTLITQLKHQGVFDKVKGVVLGYYTEMQRDTLTPKIEEIFVNIIDNHKLPIIKTDMIGHSKDSKALKIGEYYRF